jgi:dCMP deaminase
MTLAKDAATRSTCKRRQVGAVLVKNDHVIAMGYNGSPRGTTNCIDAVECIRQKMNIPSGEQLSTCAAVHAEANAIIQAALHGVSPEGATLYCTDTPCVHCTLMLINAGVKTFYAENEYPLPEFVQALMKQADIHRYVRVDEHTWKEI